MSQAVEMDEAEHAIHEAFMFAMGTDRTSDKSSVISTAMRLSKVTDEKIMDNVYRFLQTNRGNAYL